MPGLLGKKIGMTRVYTEDGISIPVTVLEVGPCTVYTVKTTENDGYEALQLGFGKGNEKRIAKAQKTYFNNAGLSAPKYLKEFKGFNIADYKVGDEIKADFFQIGEKVKVSGKSKGKGFQGVMKRHGFGGVGGATHGQHNRLRAPGSIGQSSYPSRVFKGTRMAGRKGYETFTTTGLRVVQILSDKNIVMVKGAVPGSINSIVEIKK